MKSFKTIRSVFSVAILLAGVLGTNNLMAESKDGSLSVDICAPESEDDSSEDDHLYINEYNKRAIFPGGQIKMATFIKENLKYPEDADGAHGRVIVNFVVEEDGSISDIKVVRGVHPSLDAEAVRVVKLMPKWKPAEYRGKPVRTKYMLPVFFRIQDVQTNKKEQP
ncbi:MAG: energy transducer TonB [Paludibacteraceae bacterium]|nr:energy transducer TonB [Paludibacteraceae bacterium]